MKTAALGERNQPYALIVVFCLLAICIVASGFLYYRHSVATFELEVERRLAAVTELRGSHIEQYRNERLSDAAVYRDNAAFTDAVERFLAEPGAQASRTTVEGWLAIASLGGHYERISLVDAQGLERLAVSNDAGELSSLVIQKAKDSMGAGEVDFVEPYRSEHDQRIYLAVVSPVICSDSSSMPLAVVVLAIDPEDYLYRAIGDTVATAGPVDTVLIRDEGDQLLFLSDPTHLAGGALTYRLSVDQTNMSVVQAVAAEESMVRGDDLSGVSEVAYGRAIAESNWYVVSSISKSEAFAPLRRMQWLIVVLISALLIGVAAALFGTVLDTAEIRRKDEELHKKNVELERFTYGVSHDLKSPLWTVKTFLGFLEEDITSGADTAQLQKNVHRIRGGADRMGRLLDELLKMSRVGRQEDSPRNVHVNDVIQEALDAVAGRVAERQVVVHVKEEAITLYADPSRLVEIWQNLLDNAVKYMGDQAHPEIEVGTERAGRDTVFYVKDNGMGIEPQFQTKAFELFERLDNEGDSTGLGLALVKRIVELYKGNVWVESAGQGRGSTFKFTLPAAHVT